MGGAGHSTSWNLVESWHLEAFRKKYALNVFAHVGQSFHVNPLQDITDMKSLGKSVSRLPAFFGMTTFWGPNTTVTTTGRAIEAFFLAPWHFFISAPSISLLGKRKSPREELSCNSKALPGCTSTSRGTRSYRVPTFERLYR